MADGITLDKVNVEIESNSSKASSGIDKLTESIKKLKASLSGGIEGLDKLNTSLQQIHKSFSNFNNATSGMQNAQKGATQLGNGIKVLSENYKTVRKNQNMFGREIKNQSLNGELQYAVFQKQSKGMTELTKVSDKGVTVTKKLTKENKNLSKALNLVKVAAAFKGLSMVYKKIMNLVKGSSQYISNLNYFNTTMGSMGKTATKFVNQMSTDFYLDPSNLMNYMASFNSLIKGFGIAEEQSYKMSKNLTQLSYDLAAFKGISIEDAMQKIKSGISGELEPMRAIGVALDQATLQETAYDLGIKKRVNTMTRAQKTELLYYQMMKSTAEAQNYFASTLAKTVNQLDGSTKLILNPATALSLLKQQFNQLGRAVGNIFIPILIKAIPYIMAITQLLTDLANFIASKLGFKIEDFSFGSSLENASSGIDNIGDSADKTTKKVKKMLAPFDELNTISFGNDDDDGLGSLSGGSLGIKMPEYDWLKNEELTKRVEEIKEKFKKILPIVAAIGLAIIGWKVGSIIFKFFGLFSGKDTKNSIKGTTNLFKGFFDGLGKAAQSIAILGGMALVIKSLTGLIIAFSESGLSLKDTAILLGSSLGILVAAFGATLGIMKLLNPSWQSIAGAIVILGGFALIINQVSNLLKIFSETGLKVSDVAGLMASIFIPIVALMGSIALIGPLMTAGLVPFSIVMVAINATLLVVAATLPKILDACAKFISSTAPSLSMLLTTIGNLITKIIYALGTTLPPIINSVGNLFTKIFNGISKVVSTVGGSISKILNSLKSLVTTVLNSIISFINRLGPAINKFVDNAIKAVTKLINFMVSGIEYLVNTLVVSGINRIIRAINSIGEYVGIYISTISPMYIPRFRPKLYEEGGFPEVGDLFIANENGPEWISTMGGKSAVANQDQMTTGIRQAAYEGVSQALKENPQSHNTDIYIGNEKIYSGYGRYQSRQANKYGVVIAGA